MHNNRKNETPCISMADDSSVQSNARNVRCRLSRTSSLLCRWGTKRKHAMVYIFHGRKCNCCDPFSLEELMSSSTPSDLLINARPPRWLKKCDVQYSIYTLRILLFYFLFHLDRVTFYINLIWTKLRVEYVKQNKSRKHFIFLCFSHFNDI